MGIDRGQGTPVSSNPLELDNDDYSSTVVGPQGPKGDDGDITPEYTQMYNDTIAAKNTATSKASEASASASNAATSETNANTSANAASASATSASNSASASATSETNAATSESNAASSATAAASSATSASGSASTATTKASEAATSASTATTKASEAATSASTATTKASEAATSATNTASSESAASTSATNAATSATAAASSASNASTSETNAASSATSAATSATNAAASESSVATNASNAATSETNAANSATAAASSASTATTKASEASTSASTATTKASEASTSASNAATSATNAATSATNAAASFDSFDDRYLGSKSSEPTVDNDGDALLTGALYFNSTTNTMKVYSGSAWLDAYATLSGALLATNNLSDLNNAATARTNLGLGTAATTASTDYATSAQGTTADNALPKAGGTMTGDIAHGDNVRAKFGASDDLQIFHDGSNSYIKDSGTGDLKLQGNNLTIGNTADTKYFTAVNGGKTAIYHQGNEKLATTSTGVDVTGTVTADGAIYLDGGTGYGQVEVGGDSGGYIDIKKPNSDDYDARLIYSGSNFDIHTNADEPIRLRHNNSTKLATTSSGVDVTGLIESNTLSTDYKKIYGISSGSGDNYYFLGSLRLGTQTDGYADIVIHRSVDHGQAEATKTVVNLSQRNGTLSTGCQVYGNLSNGNNLSIKVYQDGNDLDVYLFTDDYAQSVLDITHKGGSSWQTSQGSSVTPTGTEVYDSNDEVQFIINESGNVGIGTSSPDANSQLHIKKTGANAKITLETDESNDCYINFSGATSEASIGYEPTSNALIFANAADGLTTNERMRIDSSGNVGIGTSNPAGELEINSSGDSDVYIRSGDGNAASLYFGSQSDSQEGAIRYYNSNNSLRFFGYNMAERMRIDSSGRVGIGRTPTGNLLEVADSIKLTSLNTGEGFIGFNAASQKFAMTAADSAAGGVKFEVGTAERMRIDSSGNVLVGKTSTSSATVGAEIRPEGRIFGTTNSQFALLLNRTSTDGDIAVFRKDGSTVGSIGVAGGDLAINSSATNHAGLRLGLNTLLPMRDGSLADGTIDIGQVTGTSYRFKDAHFSGTVNATAFVGDGSGLTGISGGGSAGGSTAITMNDNVKINLGNTPTSIGELYNNGSKTILNTSLGTGQPLEVNVNGHVVITGEAVAGSWGYYDSVKLHAAGSNPSVSNWSNWSLQTLYQGVSINGMLHQNVDNTYDIGGPTRRWDDIYATNGTIQTSDRNEKQDIEELSDAEQRVAIACKGLMRKFRWKDAVEEKGEDARTHFGIIAQDLQAAFEAEGLDAGKYAMFISTTWWEAERIIPAVEAVEAQDAVYEEVIIPAVLDEDGNEVEPERTEQNLVSEAVEAVEAVEEHTVTDTFDTFDEAPEGAVERTRMGVRYSELLAFIIAAI